MNIFQKFVTRALKSRVRTITKTYVVYAQAEAVIDLDEGFISFPDIRVNFPTIGATCDVRARNEGIYQGKPGFQLFNPRPARSDGLNNAVATITYKIFDL